MSILEELYKGNIDPSERFIKKGGEYQKLNKQLAELIDELIPLLNNKESQLCEKIGDCASRLSCIAEREHFIEGFRMGAQIILEIYNYESSNYI